MRSLLVRLLLGLASTIGAVLFLELGVRLFDDGSMPPKRSLPKPYDPIADAELGYRLKSSSRFRAQKTLRGNPCYDVVYATDGFGRRDVGSADGTAASRPRLVLFGCSFTFGEGLRDADTLPFHLGRHFEVFNYALHGYGPQHALALLRGERLRRELPPGEALGVYVFHPPHLLRAAMRSDLAWLFNSPYFELEADGSLRAHARYAAAHPIRTGLYRALNSWRDRFLLLRRIQARWPLQPDPARAELTAAILIEAARRFEEQWKGPFHVAIEGENDDRDATGVLLQRLRDAGVAVIDDRKIEIGAERVCEGDGHPNGRYNAALAHRLAGHLLAAARGADDPPLRPPSP